MSREDSDRSIRLLGLCLLAGLLWGCGPDPGEFRVTEILPPPSAGPLLLNQTLTIVFSDTVDPSSVSRESISLRLAGGLEARGRLSVAGARVRFHPAPVSSVDLEDGGYLEGGELTLTLSGFPGRNGVLSGAGETLRSTAVFHLEVVTASAGPPAALFLDPDGGAPPRLLNRLKPPGEEFARVRPGGRIRLVFSEPLLPGSVHSGTIQLLYDNPDRDPVESEILFDQGEARAVVELRPAGGFRQDGVRYLLVLSGAGVRDLVGNRYDSSSVQEARLRVDARGDEIVGGNP